MATEDHCGAEHVLAYSCSSVLNRDCSCKPWLTCDAEPNPAVLCSGSVCGPSVYTSVRDAHQRGTA